MPHYLHFLYLFRWQHLSRPILKVAATRMASAAICIGYPTSSSISKGFGSAESKEKGVGCGRQKAWPASAPGMLSEKAGLVWVHRGSSGQKRTLASIVALPQPQPSSTAPSLSRESQKVLERPGKQTNCATNRSMPKLIAQTPAIGSWTWSRDLSLLVLLGPSSKSWSPLERTSYAKSLLLLQKD